MDQSPTFLSRAARWFTLGSAVAILFSIAVSQILLGLAVAALLLSGSRCRAAHQTAPRTVPVGDACGLAFSAPGEMARPSSDSQNRSFRTCSWSIRRAGHQVHPRAVSHLGGLRMIAGVRGIMQFIQKLEQARQLGGDDYSFSVGERITGFMSHWNTFRPRRCSRSSCSAHSSSSPRRAKRMWLWIAASACGFAVLLAETRAVWIGTAVAAVYLVWFWRRWLVVPVPWWPSWRSWFRPGLRDRFTSLVHPKTVDSNNSASLPGVPECAWWWPIRCSAWVPKALDIISKMEPAGHPRRSAGWYGHLHNIYLGYPHNADHDVDARPSCGILARLAVVAAGPVQPPLSPPSWDRGGPGHPRRGVAEYNLGDSEVLTMFLVVVAGILL